MKGFLIGVVLTLALTITAGALAATAWSKHGNGYWCKTASGGIACAPESGEGYGVGLERRFVFVMNLQTQKEVFFRRQP